MKFIVGLFCFLAVNASALEASASMGNVRKSAASETKIQALTTIVEALGTDLKATKDELDATKGRVTQTEAELAAFKNCAEQSKIYDAAQDKCILPIAKVDKKVLAGSTQLANLRGNINCPKDYEVVACAATGNGPGGQTPSSRVDEPANGCYFDHSGIGYINYSVTCFRKN